MKSLPFARGFTLIETVVVIALSVIAMIAISNLFLIFNTIYGHQQAFIATAGSASNTMNSLETYVLQADRILFSRSFSGTNYQTGSSTLILSLPTVDSSGNIVSGAKDYVVYYVASSTLYRLLEAHAQSARVSERKTLSTTINSITFTYGDSDYDEVDSVSVDVRTRATYKDQILESRLVQELFLRNYSPI